MDNHSIGTRINGLNLNDVSLSGNCNTATQSFRQPIEISRVKSCVPATHYWLKLLTGIAEGDVVCSVNLSPPILTKATIVQQLLPFALLGFALLVFGWVMFRLMIRKRSKKKRTRSPEQQVADVRAEMKDLAPRGDRALRDAPKDVLRWQVEMTETARDLKGELDTKIAILNATVRLADHRIAELKALLEKVESQSQRD